MQKDLKQKIYLLIENTVIVPLIIVASLNNIFYPLKLNEIILLVLIYELLLFFYKTFLHKYIKVDVNLKNNVKTYSLVALLILSILLKGIIKR